MRTILALLALAAQLGAAQPGPVCERGEATLHMAWGEVFWHYPERLDPAVDGYIAVNDCGEMGEYRRLWFGGRWWRVKVADCRNPADPVGEGWLVDVDYRIWFLAQEPVTPREVVLCREMTGLR